ncbi:RND transporter, Hydrophobe/Amphiphile Efflux-1 (HAE1)/Heavy Metal Efflux (HME) family, permease protein [Leptospira wolbachii serovar Codice str. CDC]|uniref:RND transporter, Hydrophobe/Amphiphile Efflux-1 (HAE1)/Heavy Metal Efflux (HME) family, permease protein n=1 Tax=Leptospira wolbachii serovar Codice str. CDC TaxID=1218599 RepID=R9A2V1_9LEPT|nr:efflux RND transporter permease subunit [Leptospira wolbachii]EOQ96538.1 RND transporter, Hydrophobe/Amphiphile Efflux-1 (HAE1)/Heavy Metal Efflux (HME) family, permease protein [Leptospira wolbachii serovar Codice str. CDC]
MNVESYVHSLFKHKRLYWVVFICFFLAAFFRIPELEIWLLPRLTPIRYYIVTEFPNHSAEETDLSVSVPISEMVSSVKSVKRIRTISEHGKSVVQIDLQFGASVSEFKDQLYQTILEMNDKLPLGVGAPRLLQGEAKERPFMEILIPKGIGNDVTSFDFRFQQLVFQLERISGVTEVRVVGKPKHSAFISIKTNVLDLFPISIRDLESQIQAAMRGGSLGKIEGYTKDTELKFSAEIQSYEDLSQFPIHLGNGNSVSLGRLTTIFKSEFPAEKLTRMDGKNAIYIAVFTDSSANPLRVSSEVQKKFQTLDSNLSPKIFYDASNELHDQIHQFGINLIWSLTFAFVFSYFLYRSWVPALILLVSVLFSLVLFFHLVLLFSISINILSLGGISVGIGMLFDASNLIVFSIRKKLEKMAFASESVTKGIQSVFISLFSSSLTTIVVFIPLLVFPMEWKNFFFDSGVCIALLVFCSLVSSLWIVPLLSISLMESLKKTAMNTDREKLLVSMYERTYNAWNTIGKKNAAVILCCLLLFSFFVFEFKWHIFPKQPAIGFRMQMSPKSNLSLEEELGVVYELQSKMQKIDPKLSTLVFPLDPLDTKRQHPQKSIPIQWKLLGIEKSKELETLFVELLPPSKWDWKLEPIESQVSITLPFIPNDSLVFLHESFDALLNFSREFRKNISKRELNGNFDFLPNRITLEEWSRNQIPIPEFIPDEEDLKHRILYQQIPKYLGPIGDVTKTDLYLGMDSFGLDLGNRIDPKRISFKTKTNEATFIGTLFTSQKQESYDQYHRESGLFYTEWMGEVLEFDSSLFAMKNGLSVIQFSAKKEIRKFFLFLFVLLLLSFVFIYLALVGIYESFRIPIFYLGLSLLYLSVTVSFVFVLFREFHLGHYIGLVVLLGLSIDSISLFGERWVEIREDTVSSKQRESIFRWLVWPILLNSGTTLMGVFPVIAFGTSGSEFSKAIALTMFVGIPVSVFFVFYVYPNLFLKFLVKIQ